MLLSYCVAVDDFVSSSKEENPWEVQDYDPEYNEKNKPKGYFDWLF
jgi:hypothetical protein